MTARLQQHYQEQVRPALTKRFGFHNPMQVPRLTKIVLNRGIGDSKENPKIVEGAVEDLTAITGQKPVLTRAKKSIAQFKIREGYVVGCRVTLRRQRMYEFFDRLISVALPQIRDFQGMGDRAFDGRGNYNLGLTEQVIFPEINYDDISQVAGMTVTICTNAPDDEQAKALLQELGMPFSKPLP
ncbi:MAG: 50S ribosomal protein L5 [Candidatus Coatesbacteria bacterium]|nr:50S ribosomal protein L5 [Candidatus Coatesbacteria bacterium]